MFPTNEFHRRQDSSYANLQSPPVEINTRMYRTHTCAETIQEESNLTSPNYSASAQGFSLQDKDNVDQYGHQVTSSTSKFLSDMVSNTSHPTLRRKIFSSATSIVRPYLSSMSKSSNTSSLEDNSTVSSKNSSSTEHSDLSLSLIHI